MRLGPLEIRSPVHVERAFADTYLEVPPTRTIDPGQGPVAGADGQSPFGLSNLWAEDNRELLPPMRFNIFNQMRHEDPIVRSTLWLYKLPIRAAQWTIVPASQDPVDMLIADACAWNFGLNSPVTKNKLWDGQTDLSFDEQLQQQLLHLDFGSMFEETIWGEAVDFNDGDGDTHLFKPIGRLAPRFPATFRYPDAIEVDSRTGLITNIHQNVPKTLPIPGSSLTWFTLDREGNDFLGRALIRPMYGAWRMKRATLITSATGYERYAFGMPVVRYPDGSGKRREAEGIGRNWRTHERSYVTLEGTVAQGWDVQIVGQGSFADPTSLLRAYNDEMQMGALQHFMGLGRTVSGSRALGDVQVEPFYEAAQAVANGTGTQWQRLIFRRFVDVNFGPMFDVPRLTAQKIGPRNIQVLTTAISALADAGFNFTDPDTVNDVRDLLDLRHAPEEVQQVVGSGEVGVEPTPGIGMLPGQPPDNLPPSAQPDKPGITGQGLTTVMPQATLAGREGDDLGY